MEINKKSQKYFPFAKMAENYGDAAIHLNKALSVRMMYSARYMALKPMELRQRVVPFILRHSAKQLTNAEDTIL